MSNFIAYKEENNLKKVSNSYDYYFKPIFFKRHNTLIQAYCYYDKPHPLRQKCFILKTKVIFYDKNDVPVDNITYLPWTESYINDLEINTIKTIDNFINLMKNYSFIIYTK